MKIYWNIGNTLSERCQFQKGAGNIEYGDIENGEIEKMGTSEMKQREYREKNNGNIEIKIENGEIEKGLRNWLLNNTSVPVGCWELTKIPQYRLSL